MENHVKRFIRDIKVYCDLDDRKSDWEQAARAYALGADIDFYDFCDEIEAFLAQ